MANLTDLQIKDIASLQKYAAWDSETQVLLFARAVEKATQDAMRRNTEMTLRGNEAASNKRIATLEAQVKELKENK